MVFGGAVPPPRILNCILVPHRIIKAGVYPQNACGNTPAIFLKKMLVTTNRCDGFNGAAHPLCGNKPWGGLFVFFVRDTMNINLQKALISFAAGVMVVATV